MAKEILAYQLTTIHYWLAVKLIPRLAIHKKIALVKQVGLTNLFESDKLLETLPLTKPQCHAIKHPDWHRINSIIEQAHACHSEIVTFSDSRYPERLKQIYDPPLVLFCRGNSTLLNLPQIAIVGSRNATAMGRETAQQFSADLSYQFVITSGLAIGIDAFAHRGALLNENYTIAVVATGLDQVYPAHHKKLHNDILQNNGLIISEFLPGVSPKAGHFPKRNRIISGLSLGVVIIEASMKSGSLITARCALEQNREVFAVPSSIFNLQAKGCHWLIKQGAKLVDDVADIKDDLECFLADGLHLQSNKEKDKPTEKSEKQDLCNDPMLASVGYEITPIDVVVSRSKLPTDIVLTRLTMLELKGLVSSVPGGYLKLYRG